MMERTEMNNCCSVTQAVRKVRDVPVLLEVSPKTPYPREMILGVGIQPTLKGPEYILTIHHLSFDTQ